MGFQNFHTSVTAGSLCSLLPRSVCLLLLSPVVICWQAGRDGENPSLWFLSLHIRGATCGPDRQILLGQHTLSITTEMIQMKSRILHILNALSSSAIRIKTFVFLLLIIFSDFQKDLVENQGGISLFYVPDQEWGNFCPTVRADTSDLSPQPTHVLCIAISYISFGYIWPQPNKH